MQLDKSLSPRELLNQTADGLIQLSERARERAADIREYRAAMGEGEITVEEAISQTAESISILLRDFWDDIPWQP